MTAVRPRTRPADRTPGSIRRFAAVSALLVAASTVVAAPAMGAEEAAVGDDPLRDEQWALSALEAEEVWEAQTATGSLVAVVDTGVDAAHPDLADVVVPGLSTVDAPGDGTVDPNGHGTGVAGIIGAQVGNGVGMAGLARGVSVLPVQVLDRFRLGRVQDVEAGIRYAGERGADVVNLSFGSADPSERVRAAIDDVVLQGTVAVASAGNTFEVGNEPRFPAADSDVLSVAAVDRDLRPAAFSTANDSVDIAAPGVDVLMTIPDDGADPAGRYITDDGTSFAAPYVSAAAALVAARYPRATPAQITERLLESARDLGEPGRDDATGHGLVQPLAALAWEAGSGCQVPAADPLQRAWDDDRVATAAAVACTYWPVGATPTVVLATAGDYPDALAGAALAARRGAPLLLTGSDGLRPDVAQVLAQLGVTDAVLLGGTAAIGEQVATDLGAQGIATERIAGDDRYATAAAVARSAGGPVPRVIVATGAGYADALAAGAYLAQDPSTAAPVVLTRPDRLSPAAAAVLTDLAPGEITVVGGPAALSDAVVEGIGREVPDAAVRRVAGQDRYGTSEAVVSDVAVADEAPVVLATGAAFPDALAAGPLAAQLGGPLLLVDPGDAERAAEVVADGPWGRGVLVGGRAAISAAASATLSASLDGGPPAP